MIDNNPNASSGQYLAVEQGNNDTDGLPVNGRFASYSFTMQKDTCKIQARVIAPTADDDSFYFNIPGATTQTANHTGIGVRWNNIEPGSDWHGDVVRCRKDDDTDIKRTMNPGRDNLENH